MDVTKNNVTAVLAYVPHSRIFIDIDPVSEVTVLPFNSSWDSQPVVELVGLVERNASLPEKQYMLHAYCSSQHSCVFRVAKGGVNYPLLESLLMVTEQVLFGSSWRCELQLIE